jgi:hypothetical protein
MNIDRISVTLKRGENDVTLGAALDSGESWKDAYATIYGELVNVFPIPDITDFCTRQQEQAKLLEEEVRPKKRVKPIPEGNPKHAPATSDDKPYEIGSIRRLQ